MTTIALDSTTQLAYRGGFPDRESMGTLCATMNKQISDEVLMQQYQQGDNEAFNQLYNRHKDAIYRYLERQCMASIAEEIFQDVWLKIIQFRHQFKSAESSRFLPYLYKIAHNRLMDHFRSHRLKARIISDQDPETAQYENNDASNMLSPEIHTESNRKLGKLLELIQELPAEQREAFLLKEESGMSIQEIADITGVSRETAKSRLRYAFQRIRDGMRGVM